MTGRRVCARTGASADVRRQIRRSPTRAFQLRVKRLQCPTRGRLVFHFNLEIAMKLMKVLVLRLVAIFGLSACDARPPSPAVNSPAVGDWTQNEGKHLLLP
jgi:hypothetical protein